MATVVTSTCYGYYVTTPSVNGIISTNKLWIKAINCHAGAAGDYIDLQDNDGRDVAKFVFSSTHSSDTLDLWESPINGLKISSVNGTLSTLSILIL